MDHAKILDVLTSLPVSHVILPRVVCFATSRPANHAICRVNWLTGGICIWANQKVFIYRLYNKRIYLPEKVIFIEAALMYNITERKTHVLLWSTCYLIIVWIWIKTLAKQLRLSSAGNVGMCAYQKHFKTFSIVCVYEKTIRWWVWISYVDSSAFFLLVFAKYGTC